MNKIFPDTDMSYDRGVLWKPEEETIFSVN